MATLDTPPSIDNIVRIKEDGLVGEIIAIHRKGIDYDDNLKENMYYVVEVFLPHPMYLYFTENEIEVIREKSILND